MTVGQLVVDTRMLQRVLVCEHVWAPHSATPSGKEYLIKQAARRLR